MSDFKNKQKRKELSLGNLPILNRNVPKERPGPMDLMDKSTYISNPDVRKKFDLWEHFLEEAKNPKTKEERISAKDTKRRLYETYNKPEQRKTMGDDELKLIGKHKSQLNRPVVTPVITPVISPVVTPEVKTEVKEFISREPKMRPGISDDLIRFRKEVNKNMEYVMGKNDDLESDEKDRAIIQQKETIND